MCNIIQQIKFNLFVWWFFTTVITIACNGWPLMCDWFNNSAQCCCVKCVAIVFFFTLSP